MFARLVAIANPWSTDRRARSGRLRMSRARQVSREAQGHRRLLPSAVYAASACLRSLRPHLGPASAPSRARTPAHLGQILMPCFRKRQQGVWLVCVAETLSRRTSRRSCIEERGPDGAASAVSSARGIARSRRKPRALELTQTPLCQREEGRRRSMTSCGSPSKLRRFSLEDAFALPSSCPDKAEPSRAFDARFQLP